MSGIIKPSVGAQLKLDHPLAQGLVGAWLLNEGSGDKIHDYSGQGNIGTLTNMNPATDWVGSIHGGALDFDGSDDYISVAVNSSINISGDVSLSLWFKLNNARTSSTNYREDLLNKEGNYALTFQANDGRMQFAYYNGAWRTFYSMKNSWNANQWYHIVLVHDTVAQNDYWYIDGMLDNTTADTRSTDSTSFNLLLGAAQTASPQYSLNGFLHNVYIYNRTLSAQDIAWLYAFSYAMFEEESPYWIPFKAAGGAAYNESVTFSSGPSLTPSGIADLLGSVGLTSTPALSPAAIADFFDALTMLSSPAMSMACVLDMFPSLALLSNPALGVSALADFYNSLTLASTPAAVMAAIADLFSSLALASDPSFAALGGSDFYESLALSSSPALSNAAFKEAFGELTLMSNPALSAGAIANLYAAITMASSAGISLTALADLFTGFSLSSIPALSALGQVGGIFIQKMVMESIGLVEKLLRIEKQEADGDIEIRNLILSNPYDEIAPVSTTWEATKKIQKDGE